MLGGKKVEMNETVILEVEAELAAVKLELERLEHLEFSSELKEQRIQSLKQEIQQAEGLLGSQANV